MDGRPSVEIKLCFSDGLVWTVDLTVKIKLHFQISPAYCGWDLSQVLGITTNTFTIHAGISLNPY